MQIIGFVFGKKKKKPMSVALEVFKMYPEYMD